MGCECVSVCTGICVTEYVSSGAAVMTSSVTQVLHCFSMVQMHCYGTTVGKQYLVSESRRGCRLLMQSAANMRLKRPIGCNYLGG